MNTTPTFSQTFEVDGLNSLQLRTFAGDIELIGHDEQTLKIEAFVWDRSVFSLFLVKELVENQTGQISISKLENTLIIASKVSAWSFLAFRKVSFRIYLPASISTDASTLGGDVKLKYIVGNHSISTWGGNLLIENSKGILTGKTKGGNVHLMANEGEINGSTSGGNIYINQHKGQIKASTWGGNIEASAIFGDFESSTWGGNIRLYDINGNIGASTKGGNISAQIPTLNQYAWFDTLGGNIKIALPLENPMDIEVSANRIFHPQFQNFQGIINRQTIKGKLNGGGTHVTIKTGSGRIEIEDLIKPNIQNSNSQESLLNAGIAQKETKKTNFSKEYTSQKVVKQPLSFNAKEALFALVFCVLLVYGLSSITYFTLEFLNPKNILGPIYKGVFFTNINNGIGAMISVYIFIHFIEFRIRSNIRKYASLIGITSLYSLIFQLIIGYVYWRNIDPELWRREQNNYDFKFIYTVIPLIVACIYFYYWQRTGKISRKISEQEYQLLNLEKLKSKAQLDALEAKINPHFLYNSLNSIAGLIHDKPEKAEEMTIQLSKLFRYTTGRDEENLHTVADELEIIKAYLSIEQVRFGARLNYKIDCEEGILEVQIPRFLLQPIVENAIKHGISKIAHSGEIKLLIKELENRILISIHDNGPDFSETLGGGFGLRSIKEKLQLVFGDKASVELVNLPEKAVIISLPILKNEI